MRNPGSAHAGPDAIARRRSGAPASRSRIVMRPGCARFLATSLRAAGPAKRGATVLTRGKRILLIADDVRLGQQVAARLRLEGVDVVGRSEGRWPERRGLDGAAPVRVGPL